MAVRRVPFSFRRHFHPALQCQGAGLLFGPWITSSPASAAKSAAAAEQGAVQ